MIKNYIFFAMLIFSSALFAQTPNDLQFIPKGTICGSLGYGYNSWSKYWEGEVLRENGNVGTVSRQQISVGFDAGITKRLNLFVMAPYIITAANQGTLNGQNGVQDLSIFLKGDYAQIKMGPGKLKIGGNIGFSIPISKYLIDFAPLNIGMGTTNLSYRQMIAYQLDKGFYLGAKANYTYRSNISNIHRDFYYDQGHAYYSNEVQVPNVFEWVAALGFSNTKILAEVDYNAYNTLGGADIRIWEPGFPGNEADGSTVTGRFDYYMNKNLSFSLTGGYTLSGKNIGQASFGNIAIQYLFQAWGKAAE